MTSTREDGTVTYALAGPDVADLMRAARSFPAKILAGRADMLDVLGAGPPADPAAGRRLVGLNA